MVMVAALLIELFGICSNGVLPSAKLVAALVACNKRSAICCSELPEQWCSNACALLRIIAGMYRLVATNTPKLTQCLSKAFELHVKVCLNVSFLICLYIYIYINMVNIWDVYTARTVGPLRGFFI